MKLIHIILFSIILFSCATDKKEKKILQGANNTQIKDTINFLRLIKSYEPERYSGKVPSAFYSYRGQFDWWRFQVVYPYAIHCIDLTSYGRIADDKGLDLQSFKEGCNVNCLTEFFDKFIFDENYFVGNKIRDPFSSDTKTLLNEYFIFNYASRSIIDLSGQQNLQEKLRQISFKGDTTFLKIEVYANRLR